MPRIVISNSSTLAPSSASTSSPSSPVGNIRGSLRIRDNKTDVALSAASRAFRILDQLNGIVPSVPGLGLATSAARSLIDEAKSARRRRKDCEDLAEYVSKSLQDVSRRLVDRGESEWPSQVEEKMQDLARVFIETSTIVRKISDAKGWRTFIMRESYDAMLEKQRAELSDTFHTFNVVLNLDTNITVCDMHKDVRALRLNQDRDELGYLRIRNQDIKHIEANTAGKGGWYAGTTNVHLAGHEGIHLCKEYGDLPKWRDDLKSLKKLRCARLPELVAYSAQADAPQLFILTKPVPHLDIQMWTIKTLLERSIIDNVYLYYHGLRTLRDAAKYVQQQFVLTDEQLRGLLLALDVSNIVVDRDDSFLLSLPTVDNAVDAHCLWYAHLPGCLGQENPLLCHPDPCAPFKSILHPLILSSMVLFSETGNMTHEKRYMTRQRQFYDLIDTLSLTLWERITQRYGLSYQHLIQSYMMKRANEISLRELRRLASLGDIMPWYQTEFIYVGFDNGIVHPMPGTYGWAPPHDPAHPDVRDMCRFIALGDVQDVAPELLTPWQENVDVTIRLSQWGEPYPKVGLKEWRSARPTRFRTTITATHRQSVLMPHREHNFWRFLAEHGAELADKHKAEHPLMEAHDPIVVCCVESEFKCELDVDLTDPQWSLVEPDCHFKPVLDFLERAPLEPAPNPYLSGLTTVILGQLCGHTEATSVTGTIAWHEHPETKLSYHHCDCVLVPGDVDLAPSPPETNLRCQCNFCTGSASHWTMTKTWVAKLDREDFQVPP